MWLFSYQRLKWVTVTQEDPVFRPIDPAHSRLECYVVALEVVGSSPIIRPLKGNRDETQSFFVAVAFSLYHIRKPVGATCCRMPVLFSTLSHYLSMCRYVGGWLCRAEGSRTPASRRILRASPAKASNVTEYRCTRQSAPAT